MANWFSKVRTVKQSCWRGRQQRRQGCKSQPFYYLYCMKIIALLLLVIIISAFSLPSISIELKGHLRSKAHHNVGGLVVFANGNMENGGEKGGIAASNKNGDFNMHFILHYDTIPVSFYYVNEHKDTILLKRVNTFESDEPEMTFWIK